MEFGSNRSEENIGVSVLHGDGFCVSKILSREPSVGKSSRIYYRSAEGIPFKWELQPGTPKTPQEEDLLLLPPLSPPPLMQSLGLPRPNGHQEKPQGASLKTASRIWSLKERVKKRMNHDVSKVEMVGIGNKANGELPSSNKDSSVSSVSTSSVSESSFSSNSRVLDSSMTDGPFCCSPWDVPAILVEGTTTIYYCSYHRTTFALEEDGSFLTRILSRFPAGADQFSSPIHDETAPAGVPFRWEMQPGTPKRPMANELIIPPPSPPPAQQNVALVRQGKTKKAKGVPSAWNCVTDNSKKKKKKKNKKERSKMESEISFRYHGDLEMGSSDDEFEGSVSEKTGKRSLLSCGLWRRIQVLASTWRKLKVLTS